MYPDTSVETVKYTKATLPAEGYCSIKALAQPNGVTPWAASTIWLLVRQGRFPAPERFGTRCTRWRVEVIREYLHDPMDWERKNSNVDCHRAQPPLAGNRHVRTRQRR